MFKNVKIDGYNVFAKFIWKEGVVNIIVTKNDNTIANKKVSCHLMEIDDKIQEVINEIHKQKTIDDWLSIFAV